MKVGKLTGRPQEVQSISWGTVVNLF